MVLDAFDTRNILSRNAECSSLIFGLNDPGETNDAVLNDNVVRQQDRPEPAL